MALAIQPATNITFGPPAVSIETGEFARSANGYPIGTSGLFNCIGLALHNPVTRRGCFGHLPPHINERAYLAHCIDLMGWTPVQCAAVEIVVIGGSGRGDAFVNDFADDLLANNLTMANAHDGRSYPGTRTQDIGAPTGVRALTGTYDAGHEIFHMSHLPIALPQYNLVAPVTGVPRPALHMNYVHGVTLGT